MDILNNEFLFGYIIPEIFKDNEIYSALRKPDIDCTEIYNIAQRHASRLIKLNKLDRDKIEEILKDYGHIYNNFKEIFDTHVTMKVEELYACYFFIVISAELCKSAIDNYIKTIKCTSNNYDKVIESVTIQYLTMCERLTISPSYQELSYFIIKIYTEIFTATDSVIDMKYNKSDIINKLPIYLFNKYGGGNGTPISRDDLVDDLLKNLDEVPSPSELLEKQFELSDENLGKITNDEQQVQFELDPDHDSDEDVDNEVMKEILNSMSKDDIIGLLCNNIEEGEDNE